MNSFKRLLKKTSKKISENRLIILIVLLATFLRLYRINELTEFLGEQGRDLLIAKGILEGRFTLLGPPTSISAVHFGPFYHYFNAFFLFLFRLDPLGPAIGFSLLSIVTVYFIYSTAANFGHSKAGYFSALLFAVSPWMVEYGRTTFNSFFITGFSAISFWFISKLVNEKNKLGSLAFLFGAGFFAGLALQTNFLSAGIMIGLTVLLIFQRSSLKNYLCLYAGSFLAVSPYLLFELRHKFFNTKAFFQLSGSGKAVSFSIFSTIERLFLAFVSAVYFCFGHGYPNWLSLIFSLFLLIGSICSFSSRDRRFLGYAWLMILGGILIVALYPGPMLVHYLGAIYPFVFLNVGLLFERLTRKRAKLLAYFVFLVLFLLNFTKVRFSCKSECGLPAGWDLEGVKKAGKIISLDAKGNFNVAAILDGDTRAYPYRYIIETSGKKPLGVEEYPQAELLYVIARGDGNGVLDYPVWEISSFLPAEVTRVWPIKNNISVFKLEKADQ